MGRVLTVVLVFGWATAAAGQSTIPLPQIGLPLPRIGLPLANITPPLAQLGLSPFERDSEPASGRDRARSPRHRASSTAFLWVMPVYPWIYQQSAIAPVPVDVPPAQKPRTGRLELDLPAGSDPHVYVDGYFVGMFEDLNGQLTIEPGNHRIELRQEGYEALTIDVVIAAGRSIAYRGVLTPVVEGPPAVPLPPVVPHTEPAAAGSSTFYIVPGCYVGNVPPAEAGLSAACSARQALTFTPTTR